MKNLNIHIAVKALLYWYIFIFASTEALSYLHLLERSYIILAEIFFWAVFLFFNHQEIRQKIQLINVRSKSILFILVLFVLTFIQGFFSAPNSTDSMVYHLPRVMYWVQEKTLLQDTVRSAHDYMPPFGQYILLHLYLIFENDRFLFFSQWIAYVATVIISGVIASRLSANKQTSTSVSLLVASIPVVVMQATSTKIEMIVTVLVVICTYLALRLRQGNILGYIALSFGLGLGILTKQTFLIYSVIPLGIFIISLIKSRKRNFLLLPVMLAIILIIQARFISQNLSLYDSKIVSNNDYSAYVNQHPTLAGVLSNLIKNIMLQIPVPLYTKQAEGAISSLHRFLGVDVNDCSTTFCEPGFDFKIVPVIYPQEDVASNTLHLLLIIIAGIVLLRQLIKGRVVFSISLIYGAAILSIVLFSVVLKWQPFHSRFHIPFFVIGTIPSVIILSRFKVGMFFIKVILALSVLLAMLLTLLNVLRPYISYDLFLDHVKVFAPSFKVMPKSFFVKSYEKQYFNARPYWYEPYKSITELISKRQLTEKDAVTFKLMDNFEYPLWVFMKNHGINAYVVSEFEILEETFIISTSKLPYKKEGYITECVKTEIEYGYACFSKPTQNKH